MTIQKQIKASRKANLQASTSFEWLKEHAALEESDVVDGALIAWHKEVDTVDKLAKLCDQLEQALRCANNSFVGSPEGQKQIDEALKAYQQY